MAAFEAVKDAFGGKEAVAAVPRSSNEEARLSRPAAVTATVAPRMTIAILM